MAATQSTMLELGTTAPDFALPDVSTGLISRLSDLPKEHALLVVFLCAHCPYVIHVAPELARIARDYSDKPLSIIGITSNDVSQYPADAPEPTAQFAKEQGFTFPILFDETQSIAKAYTAACTPDFFLFNLSRTLVYRGQIDNSRPSRGKDRPGSGVLNGMHLRNAIDATLSQQTLTAEQYPSIGCNIKWKPGNEPAFFVKH